MVDFVEADKPFGLFSGDFACIENWIIDTLEDLDKELGEITVINCSDEYLLGVNNEILQHNFYTDVITIDYVVDDLISGDIYISEDRIIENASGLGEVKEKEFLRVIIHGVLHLCGYEDGTEEEKQIMRQKEDYYLNKFQK